MVVFCGVRFRVVRKSGSSSVRMPERMIWPVGLVRRWMSGQSCFRVEERMLAQTRSYCWVI